MISSFKFKKIEVFSDILWKRKSVFYWNFNKINFLFLKNNSWKTTFFHIFKDILWNPNVAWSNTRGNKILTNDLIKKNLEVTLHFSIWNTDFYTIKNYNNTSKQSFYLKNWKYLWWLNKFRDYILSNNIINIPSVIYWNKSKITLNSLMRFCFIEQTHFWKNSKVEKHRSSNIIIKHNNDWRTKVLLYLYLLNVINDSDKLLANYKKLSEFSDLEGQLDSLNKQIRLITWENIVDLNAWLFDNIPLLNKISKLEGKKRKILLNVFSYNEILSNFKEIYDFNIILEGVDNWYLLQLKNDIDIIYNKILINKQNILKIEKEISNLKLKLEEIDDFLLYNLSLKIDMVEDSEKDLLKTLYKNKEDLRTKTIKYKEYYDGLISILYNSNENKLLKEFLDLENDFLNIDLWLQVELESWKYTINTTSDSINRIILFNILTSFIFLKNKLWLNHLGFIVFDSPFTWLDSDNELNAINGFINNVNAYWFDWQLFAFLNPEEISIEDIEVDNSNFSVKEINGKLFDFG